MSTDLKNHPDPIIREAYEESQRPYYAPELREQARQRKQFIREYNYDMNASKANGVASAIIRLLIRRFGEIPYEIKQKLNFIYDIERLDPLVDFALDCQSLEEFEKSVR